MQTQLAAGTFVFYVLTAVIGNTPVRLTLGQPAGTAPSLTGGVAVDATGLAAFTVTSPVSAKWQPGLYKWLLLSLDQTGARTELAAGEIRIEPDPLAPTLADPRSYNEKLLTAIRTLLANKALDDAQMYKIGERELTKMSLTELQAWEAQIEARLRREVRKKQGKSIYRNAPVVFGGRG